MRVRCCLGPAYFWQVAVWILQLVRALCSTAAMTDVHCFAMLNLVENQMLSCHWQFLILHRLAVSQFHQRRNLTSMCLNALIKLFPLIIWKRLIPPVFAFLINFFGGVFMSVYFLWFLCFWAVVFVMRESFGVVREMFRPLTGKIVMVDWTV